MMRYGMMAALILSPLMIHSAGAEDRPTVKTSTLRISTGVVAPKLIHSVAINETKESAAFPVHSNPEAVVAMIVDESGKPSDLKIVQSAGAPALDENVLAAVRQYRWQPGTVSGQTVAVPLNLHITITQPGM